LRARQRALLGETAHWHAQFDTVPALPLLLIANEFFDALPVHQFVRTARGWCERYVSLVPNAEPPRLSFVLAPDPLPSAAIVPAPLRESAIGTLIELRPAAEALIESVAARIAAQDAIAALVIDYGYTARMAGDSLQALRAHKPQDPLKHPGEADLTAHVDFAALAEAARRGGARVHGPVTQGAFLAALGIAERAERLKRQAGEAERADIDAALHRLTHQDTMGTLFKVLALTRAGVPALAGFES
jgi:NADH dehydrogenase [ubiquinone] 1 alpha subcomplex assembly factor 7